MESEWQPVGEKVGKALDPDSFCQDCDLCKGEFIPEINGDSLTCDRCLFQLANYKRFDVIFNRLIVGATWNYLTGGYA